ncbi:MAG: amino acid transporter [Anaerolineae bacterium]|nr:amino acid transporter [Anaerolineae bacterium]
MSDALLPVVQGFALSAALIIAIGAQNAFVLQQGLKRNHVAACWLTAAACDAVLISLGVGGVGAVIGQVPWLGMGAAWAGAIFLLWYGFRSFRSAFKANALDTSGGIGAASLGATVVGVLAVSLLNPHAILDTVVLIGGAGAQYPVADRPLFAVGAMAASFTWFFALAFGAARLAPLFRRPVTWRVLDTLVGCLMWAIAASLMLGPGGLSRPL